MNTDYWRYIMRLLVGTAAWGLSAATAFAQCVPPAPSHLCATGWYSLGTAYDVVIQDTIGPVSITPWIKGAWKTNTAYHCALVPSGYVNNPPPAMQVQVLRTTQACWSVGGAVSTQAKTALALRLLGELSLTVQINGNFTDCVTRTDGVVGYVPSNQCFHNSGRWIYKDAKVKGTLTMAAAQTTWQCDEPTGYRLWWTECGVSTVNGNADRLWEEVFQIAPPRPECGGPSPADPLYDGKFMEKCCANMPGCDGYNPEQPACCGVIGGD